VLQEIGMVEDSPDEYIHVLLSENFWGDHPLGRSILGSRENVMSFNATMLKLFFQRFYQPEQIVIAVAGNLAHERLIDLVGPAFETIKPGNGFPQRIPPASNSHFTTTYRELEQTHVCIGTNGLSITDPRRFAFSLMNTILGGNMSSRLFQEIRENRGLAYSVYSFISSHFDTGLFGAYAAVDPKSAPEATRLILEAFETLQTTLVDGLELQGAKEYTKGNLLLASESSDNQMVRLAQNEIHFNEYIPLQTVVEKIDAVTPEDIKALAEDLFRDNKLALTLLGPVNNTEIYGSMLHQQ
jgi:predicted Zn-dependent peptidase